MSDFKQQTIRRWWVNEADCLVGEVCNRPDYPDGHQITTSPVLQVRQMGSPARPVAFTGSGSAYVLEEPAESFGADKAKAFVWEKSRRQPARPPREDADSMMTIIFRRP